MFGIACTGGDLPAQSSKLNDLLDAVEMSDLYETVDGSPLAVQNDESFAIYAQDQLPTFRIILSESAEADLVFAPREYVPASLELTLGDSTERIDVVGVKLKGQGSFRTLDLKAGFRIKIDKYSKGQTLHGLEDLTLNNMVQDRSLMAERLAYHVFRELGAPAPRANHALVYVNDEFFGVYANIETPTERFLASWFQNPNRNLYEQSGQDFHQPNAVRSFELETNEKEPDDRANLQALHDACAASDLARARELVDWPKFLLYSALEAAANQVDGYCYAQSFPNNYRIYDSDEGFVFIPWGMDWAFGYVRTQDGGLHLDPFWVRPTHGVLMRMCLADEGCASEYADVVRMVASRWDELRLLERLDEWSAQIDEGFLRDKRQAVTIEEALESRAMRREILEGRAPALLEALERHGFSAR
ncbi:MAG TPA: CotH kinase family protein [Polyangiales bacterium]|nr:CotH kinase family protein [Polyangiales bacterium]